MAEDIKPLKMKSDKRSTLIKNTFSFKAVFLFICLLVIAMVGLFGLVKSSAPSALEYVLKPRFPLETEDGRVNVLLLGMAGGKHDGATLTDTIIIASYGLDDNNVNFISIPRDLWIEKHGMKVNTLYQTGIKEDDGLGFARRETGEIFGISIPYAVRIDFSGFVKAVDLIGGIDIDVTNPFDDYYYPIEGKERDLCGYKEEERELTEEEADELGVAKGKQKVLINPEGKVAAVSADFDKGIVYTDHEVFRLFNCRFEHINFLKGLNHMDGNIALKFVRSRHGTSNEGTDFARSKRQQLVLQAFKDKVLSIETLLAPGKVISLAQTFGESFETDIPQTKYLEFLKLMKKIKEVKGFIVDSSGKDPLLITPPTGIYGAWVLIPPKNDFSRIQLYIKSVLSGSLESSISGQKVESNLE